MKSINEARRIVFKVGSSTLTHETGRFDLRHIEALTRVLSDLKNAGREVVLVTSGAIAAGGAHLNIDHRPATTEEKQALAAVGQTELMRVYDRFFAQYSHPVGQVLITRETVDNPHARKNAENTFRTLLRLGCIPVVNENDTVSFEEIEFGDNDTLSAYVAIMCGAELLINLSDIDGFYDGDPRTNPDAKLIAVVDRIDDRLRSFAGGAGTKRGTGGVATKLNAASLAGSRGIPMVLMNGAHPEKIYDLLDGKSVGTLFVPEERENAENE